jgi:hypothetical protein
MRTELESGAWAEHRPLGDLKGKDKDAVVRSARFALGTIGALDEAALEAAVTEAISHMDPREFAIAQRYACWGRLLTAWSFGLPVPVCENDGHLVNGDSFGELPLDDFDELEALFAPYLVKLTRRPDPKGSPSGTTSSSSNSSRAKAAGSPKG